MTQQWRSCQAQELDLMTNSTDLKQNYVNNQV